MLILGELRFHAFWAKRGIWISTSFSPPGSMTVFTLLGRSLRPLSRLCLPEEVVGGSLKSRRAVSADTRPLTWRKSAGVICEGLLFFLYPSATISHCGRTSVDTAAMRRVERPFWRVPTVFLLSEVSRKNSLIALGSMTFTESKGFFVCGT